MRTRIARVRWLVVAGAIAIAASCSGSSAPFVLMGHYRASLADGSRLPVQVDPAAAVPSMWIRGALLDIEPTDTLWLTTQPERLDANGNVVALLPDECVFFTYRREGDSLIFNSAYDGGRVAGSQVHVLAAYPSAPSIGYLITDHYFVFVK